MHNYFVTILPALLLYLTLPGYSLICQPEKVFIGNPTQDYHRIVEELIDELVQDGVMDDQVSVIYEDLIYLINNPVDINSADIDDLRRLFLLNDLQIQNLLNYRDRYGPIVTIYELQYIDGFLAEDIRKAAPFIYTGEALPSVHSSPREVLKFGRHQFFMRFQRVLEQQRGYAPICPEELERRPNSRYLGSPLKIYNRYQFSYSNRVQAGYVAEKDSGEEFFRGSNPYGFDYYSVHLQLNDIGKLKTIAIGDYRVSFGQGLVLWSGLSFGKSSAVLNVRKSARGIQKYSSTDENMFLRGIGVTTTISDNIETSLFLSRKRIDAVVSERDAEGNILEVSSLGSTGLHATPSGIEGKNVLGETIIGGNATFNHSLFRVGGTFLAMEYDAVLNPPERVYNQFDFRGNSNITGGLDYQFSIGRVRVFGEGALSESGGKAFILGAMSNVNSKISLSTVYRKYDPDYHARFSGGFSENTRTANEEGFYLGVEVHPYRGWKFSGYIDLYSFPWLRYGAYAPSAGMEYFTRVDFNHSGNLSMYFTYRCKQKPVNEPLQNSYIRSLLDVATQRARFHINYFVSSEVELRNRVELSHYKREDLPAETGFMVYQDILYRPVKLPLSFTFRYAHFDTDSYNARLFAYENDVLYAFSIPAYFDRGFRTYLMMQYSKNSWLDMWIRYALTVKPDRESQGSGLNETEGSRRSELKVQFRFRW